jgi:hypothetical protein
MCRNRSGLKGGCHNDRPAVESRSVFEDYEASLGVFGAFFLGFKCPSLQFLMLTPCTPSSCLRTYSPV